KSFQPTVRLQESLVDAEKRGFARRVLNKGTTTISMRQPHRASISRGRERGSKTCFC
ncbi:hypothetical protein CDV36_016562, partial [Fusarium kuroshium]